MKKVNQEQKLKRKLRNPVSYHTGRAKNDSVRRYNDSIRAVASRFIQDMVFNPTVAERKVEELLKHNHVVYISQYPIYIKDENGKIVRFYIADFYIPENNVIVEVDGGYHDIDIQKRYDAFRTEDICSYDPELRVFRITNEQVEDDDYLLDFMEEILRG